MQKLNFPAFEQYLRDFNFPRLFVDVLGWNNPPINKKWEKDVAKDISFSRRAVANAVTLDPYAVS